MTAKTNNGDDGLWLRRKEAAEYVRKTFNVPCAASTLAKLAVVGGGPPYKRFGRFPLYSKAALRDWVQLHFAGTYRSTSDYD